MAINRNYLSWQALKENMWAEGATTRLFGDDLAHEKYDYFSSPHPRFPLIPRKSLGAALLDLRGSHAEYLRTQLRTIAKKNLKLATKHGYTYAKVDSRAAIDEIMEVNRSVPQRGGRPMDAVYLDKEMFAAIAGSVAEACVVRAPDGRIVAYALVPNIGDLWLVDYVLGHGDHLKRGIMYLLMTKIIEEKFALAEIPGNPRWIMYDTLLGAGEGLRQFKRVLGFAPHWVRWRWTDRPPEGGTPR